MADDQKSRPSTDVFATLDVHALSKRVMSDAELDALCDLTLAHLDEAAPVVPPRLRQTEH